MTPKAPSGKVRGPGHPGPQCKEGVLVGMTFLGDIERAGILFYLMKNKVNVSAFKQALLADDFSLAALPVELRREMKVEA